MLRTWRQRHARHEKPRSVHVHAPEPDVVLIATTLMRRGRLKVELLIVSCVAVAKVHVVVTIFVLDCFILVSGSFVTVEAFWYFS